MAVLIRLAFVLFLIIFAVSLIVFRSPTVVNGTLVAVAFLVTMSNIIRRWRGRGPYASAVRTSGHGWRDDV